MEKEGLFIRKLHIQIFKMLAKGYSLRETQKTLKCEYSYVCVASRFFEREGLLEKRRDGRMMRSKLTKKGESVLRCLKEIPVEEMESVLNG